MFVSVGVRFEANVEALNMVETAGNYAKHRRVPYLFMKDGEWKTVYVPAVSGESLAHAFQELMVSEARGLYKNGPPVCEDCGRGEFFKSMNKIYLAKKFGGKVPGSVEEIEAGILRVCLVEDIGGFLYAEATPVKRSSAFQVSYALPVKAAALSSVTEPQLHARHAQMREVRERRRGEAAEQMIYYVETGTALYGFQLNLDLAAVGVSAVTGQPVLDGDEVRRRRRVAIMALLRMVSSQQFGAKLSRFFPVGGIVSVAAAVTEKPFSVTSPVYPGYVVSTAKRLSVLEKRFGESVGLHVYDAGFEDVTGLSDFGFAKTYGTPEEAVAGVVGQLEKAGVL